MGDRICVRIKGYGKISPTLYCHWSGIRTIGAVHAALEHSRLDPNNVICNAVITAMHGRCSNISYYLYNEGEADGMADHDNYSWTFDLDDMKWTSTHPSLEGRELSIEEAEELMREQMPYNTCENAGTEEQEAGQ